MTATSDYAALLAACIKHPDEDTPRLQLADELDEYGTDPARAELIRVQCEIARAGCRCDKCRNWGIASRDGCLVDRAAALIAANEARWRKGPVCERCAGWVRLPASDRYDNKITGYEWVLCSSCQSTRDAGGLLRRFLYMEPLGSGSTSYTADRQTVRVHFCRGFIERVEVPTLDDLCNYRAGLAGRAHEGPTVHTPTDWLRDVLTATPERGLIRDVLTATPERGLIRAVLTATPERGLIREVVPLGTQPVGSPRGYYWHDRDVPAAIQRHLPPPASGDQYATREDAVTALGRAVVTWAREAIKQQVPK